MCTNSLAGIGEPDKETVYTFTSIIGRIPYDGVAREEIVTIHPAITAFYVLLASAGIIFAVACIIFNFLYRNAK